MHENQLRPDWEVKKTLRMQWHRWFAWYPVRVGENECRWLEYVERRGIDYHCDETGSWWDDEYRAAQRR